MKIAVATLFPELVEPFFRTGIVGRAVASGAVEAGTLDIRRHGIDARGSVDDYQFGGGAGMLLRPEPLFGTLRSVEWREGARVILMAPDGRRLDQDLARDLAQEEKLIIFCGRYGGVDARFVEQAVTDEVSIGDYVVSGGELPAMVMLEAVLRWIPGVLGRLESAVSDSFATGLLDYPRYTRPACFEGSTVPEAIISGNHAQVENWRFEAALERTRARRPDLLDGRSVDEARTSFLDAVRKAARTKEREDG
jgi:tRNA (guanine37-N1)-methyltransferase